MPLRAPKMYGFIFGFQRLVWWPKWTPASRSCFMLISVIIPLWRPRAGAPRAAFNNYQATRRLPSAPARLGVHRFEELVVGLGALHFVEQELHRLDRVELREQLAQDPDPVERAARQ